MNITKIAISAGHTSLIRVGRKVASGHQPHANLGLVTLILLGQDERMV
jgi:hypothetical protein